MARYATASLRIHPSRVLSSGKSPGFSYLSGASAKLASLVGVPASAGLVSPDRLKPGLQREGPRYLIKFMPRVAGVSKTRPQPPYHMISTESVKLLPRGSSSRGDLGHHERRAVV